MMRRTYLAPLAGMAAMILAGCGTTTSTASAKISASSRSNASASSNTPTSTSTRSQSAPESTVPAHTKAMTLGSLTLRIPDSWSLGSPTADPGPGAKQVTATSMSGDKVTIHQLKPLDGNAFILLPELPKPAGLTHNSNNQSPYFAESKQSIGGVVNASFSELTKTGTEYIVTIVVPYNQAQQIGTLFQSMKAPPLATVTEAVHLLAHAPSPASAIPLVSAQSGNNRWMLAGGQPATAQEGWFLFRSHSNGSHWSLIGDTSWLAKGPTFPDSVGSPAMLFWNSQDGVIAQPSYGSSAIRVFWTRNGGTSWQKTSVPLPQSIVVFKAPHLSQGSHGQLTMTVVTLAKTTLTFTSQDGGSTWAQRN